jgi:uncharacterized protein YbjT (DUF2867 family)
MILVVGATGIVGGMITRQLLEQGKEVRILRSNSPSAQLAQEARATSAESLMEAGAQPVYGDLRDRASLGASENTYLVYGSEKLRTCTQFTEQGTSA